MTRRYLPVLVLLLLAGSAHAEPAHYRVSVASPQADRVDVRARFTLVADTIGMYVTASPQLANGSADLVASLEVRDADDRPIAATNLGMGDWKLSRGAAGEVVDVRYSVKLDHGQYDWGPGIDEVAYRTDDGLFFAASVLFVVPFGGLQEGVELEFDIPPSWHVSHPFDEDEGAIHTDATGLVDNCFFVGTHLEETISLDDFTFVLALGNDLAAERDLFVETMRPVLARAQTIFGGMPARNRYLVVANRYPRTDGGAYSGSYSILLDGPVDDASSVIWGHLIVHEVLHFWNGITLQPVSSREEWFKEGITDYLTVLLRARAGQEGREISYRKIENAYRRVVLSRMMMGNTEGLDAAGAHKQRNRMLVYGGGLLVGLALDLQIREGSRDQNGLLDLLKALYAEFAAQDRRYSVEDIQVIASRLAGRDLTEFFDTYVRGPGMLDLNPILASAGLRIDTVLDIVYVSELAEANSEQRARRAALFTDSR